LGHENLQKLNLINFSNNYKDIWLGISVYKRNIVTGSIEKYIYHDRYNMMMDLEDFAPAKPETGLVNPFLNPDSVRWENGVVSGDPDKGLVLSIYSKYLLNGDEPNDPVLDKSNGADYFIWELPSDVNFISNLSSTSILTIYLIHLILKHLLIT